MNGEVPSPLGEAIEIMGEAAQSYLDGPVAHLSAAANRAAKPNYTASQAAADAATYGLHLARAWWTGISAVSDAIAILAIPPGDSHRFEVGIPALTTPSTARIVSTAWTWMLDPEPPGTEIQLVAPPVLAPATDRLRLHARPLVLVGEPSWEVDLEITPLGSAAAAAPPLRVTLDASTRVFDT